MLCGIYLNSVLQLKCYKLQVRRSERRLGSCMGKREVEVDYKSVNQESWKERKKNASGISESSTRKQILA